MKPIVTAVSHTFIETAQRCQKKLEYRYLKRYRPRVKRLPVELGSWVHELLAGYYRGFESGDGVSVARQEHEKLLETKWNQLFDEEQEMLGGDLPHLAWQLFERYVQRWRANDEKNIRRVLLVEKNLFVKVPWMQVPFNFKCDLVYLDHLGMLWIVDHKVVKSIPSEEDRMMDAQGPRYVLGLGEWLKARGVKVRGIGMLYDYVRNRLPAEPAVTKDGSLSKRKEIDTTPETYLAAIKARGLNPAAYKEVLDHITLNQKPFFERWPVPHSRHRLAVERANVSEVVGGVLKQKETYPRHLNWRQCRWDCEYKDLCLLELEGGDISHLLREKFTVASDPRERRSANASS